MPAPHSPLDNATPFLRHVEALNHHDPALYCPFIVGGLKVGMIRKAVCPLLQAYPGILRIGEAVTLLTQGDAAMRSAALATVVEDLARNGVFALRGEAYPVSTGWGGELLATIDRAAYQFFGTPGFGVHVNGLVQRSDGLYIWVARRSFDRMVAPGKLDNLIGGGLSVGYTAFDTLIKEAEEEAGLSAEIAAQARPIGVVSYMYDTDEGVKHDVLFGYDLYLPETLVPENRDGEVDRFELMPVEAVAALVTDTNDFKTNVNLVIADLLVRHGYLKPDMPGYAELVKGLRR